MYSNATTQINLPEGLLPYFHRIQSVILEDDLHGRGKNVGTPHITVKYGTNHLDRDKLNTVVRRVFPFYVFFGDTISFPISEHSEGAVPLVIDVQSTGIRRLKYEIESNLTCLEDTFPQYIPHITLAYVKPESASKYTGYNELRGKHFIATQLTYSNKNEKEEHFG